MSGKKLWEEHVEDEDLEEVEAVEAREQESDPEPAAPAPVPASPVDEGAGRKGGSYRLDEAGNRIRVDGTESDGVRERNKANNAGPFAGRKHRERP